MAVPPATSLSFALSHGQGFTVSSPPQGLRRLLVAGVAVVSGLTLLICRAPGDAIRRRVIRKLNNIAPRKKYQAALADVDIINTDCELPLIRSAKQLTEGECQKKIAMKLI